MRGDGVPASERLVATATDLFYRKGFRAVGIEQIVEEAGLTKPTLYRNFASKDELGAACLSQLALQDMANLSAIADHHVGDPLGQIRAIIDLAACRIADPAYRGWPMSNAEIEIADRDHPARQVCERYKCRVRSHLHELCQTAGFARASALADGLLLLIEGATASWHSFGPDGPAARLSASCETMMNGHRSD